MVATNSRCSHFIRPCEPTLRDRLPKGEGWLYEVKFDGYRMQVHKAGRGDHALHPQWRGLDGALPASRRGPDLATMQIRHHRR